jgi:hypothetical protein
VLAIGGMTVAELKERLTLDEFTSWLAYAEENGPLNPMIRFDAAIARAVRPFVKGDFKSLMPYPKQPEREATMDDFMNILRASKKKDVN